MLFFFSECDILSKKWNGFWLAKSGKCSSWIWFIGPTVFNEEKNRNTILSRVLFTYIYSTSLYDKLKKRITKRMKRPKSRKILKNCVYTMQLECIFYKEIVNFAAPFISVEIWFIDSQPKQFYEKKLKVFLGLPKQKPNANDLHKSPFLWRRKVTISIVWKGTHFSNDP